jgi:hypothetical protein
MTLFDDLPLEVMSKILALVAAKKERTDWTEVPDAKSTYLQRMARYTLVCKKWNGLFWSNHPLEIRTMKASSPVVKLLHKIPFLSELQIVVRYTAVQSDLDIFVHTLLAGTAATSFADVLPCLKTLSLTHTFQNDNVWAIQKIFAKFRRKDDHFDEQGFLFGRGSDFARTGLLDDYHGWMFPVTREKYTLQRFVRFPEGMKLQLSQIVPPQDMLNVAILKLCSPSDMTDKDLTCLKRATSLRSFSCVGLKGSPNLSPAGCVVGNRLTDKLLQHLPLALLELKLGCSPEFILPTRCQWPAGLQKLFLNSIQFNAPSAGRLPDSLQHLGIDFRKGGEGSVGYQHENFDMSSLPRGLRFLELLGLCPDAWGLKFKKVKCTGAPPPSVLAVLTDNEEAFDPHSFPPSCKFGDGESSDALEAWKW